jgi:hypothetical protein
MKHSELNALLAAPFQWHGDLLDPDLRPRTLHPLHHPPRIGFVGVVGEAHALVLLAQGHNACQASFVWPYTSPQELSFMPPAKQDVGDARCKILSENGFCLPGKNPTYSLSLSHN